MDDKPPVVVSGPKAQVPNLGLYYTGDNIENSLPRLPPPNAKPNKNPYDPPAGSNRYNNSNSTRRNDSELEQGRNKMMRQDPIPSTPRNYPNRLGSKGANQVYKTPESSNKVQDEKVLQLTPWFMRPFASASTDRAVGRHARIVKIGLRTVDGARAEIYLIFLLYQMLVGAIGGIVAGIESGYLSPPAPNNGATADNMSKQGGKSIVQAGMASSKLAWRSCKRAVAAGLLFNFAEKNIEQSRGKSDWKNFAYTGVLCGGLYGLRGGPRGSLTGGAMFGAFAGLSGFYDQLKRKSKMK